MEAKIASKTLAKRVEPILHELIQCGQNVYVEGRSIFDAVRTIDDILDYTRRKCLALLSLLTLKKRLTLWITLTILKFSMHSTLGHLLFNGSVLCIQMYQVVLSTMALHQIVSQLVDV